MQEHTHVVAPQSQPKSPAPIAPSLPQPIDPALLRLISGGDSTDSLPNKGW
jgi:hypothetical protein